MIGRGSIGFLLCAGCALPVNEAPPKTPESSPESAPLEPIELSASDLKRVRSEQLVVKKSVLFRGAKKYVGGLSFLVARAPPDVVIRTIFSADAALQWMPQTLNATVVASADEYRLVRFEQGERPFVATHTLHFWRDDLAIRWKLDPTQHHDIQDAWGFLSATPYGRGHSLLTLGVMIDLGDGIVRAFAEPDIQATVLATPENIKSYVESHSTHPAASSEN